MIPGGWVHELRITRAEELDDELQRWLRTSHRRVGMQERLAVPPGKRGT